MKHLFSFAKIALVHIHANLTVEKCAGEALKTVENAVTIFSNRIRLHIVFQNIRKSHYT